MVGKKQGWENRRSLCYCDRRLRTLTDMTVTGRSSTEVKERCRYFEEHTMLRRDGVQKGNKEGQ